MEKLKSRKLVIGVIAALMIVVNDAMGKPVSEDGIYAAIGMLGVYILGQGIADHGNQGAKVAAVVVKGDEEGPNWDDTSDVDDDADERKELLG